ncbi:MAG: hypothetical protein IPL06_15425 [Betaproteobacteria bacterium]|nr:hypothetical protein [Betaproteobacteria bacterium]
MTRDPTTIRTAFAPAMRAVSLALALLVAPLAESATSSLAPGSPRAAAALERGYWVVAKGDHLYQISRQLTGDEAGTRALAAELERLNPHAFMGDASRLVIGARLRLPEMQQACAVRTSAAAAGMPASGARGTPAVPSASAGVPPVPAGVPPIAQGAVIDPPSPAPKSPPPAYTDKLIDGVTEEKETDLSGRPLDQTPGLRSWAVEARSDNRDVSGVGTTRADSLGLRYSHQTERYGDFTLQAQASQLKAPPGPAGGERSRVDATLFHDDFALTQDLLASSAAGIVRPLFPQWLSSSYRVNLNPSLLAGATTTVTSENNDLRASYGSLGRYTGFGIQQFERTSGEQGTVSASHRFGERWLAGAAAISVRGNTEVPDHTGVLVGVQREGARLGTADKLVAARSDNGENAVWFDGQSREGRLTQRYGAFQVDPQFRFGEASTSRDVRGAYWRGDWRTAGNVYSGGIEVNQDNLDRDPARGGYESVGAYGNVALKLDRQTQVGGGLSLRDERPRIEGGIARRIAQTNAFLSRATPFGQTRLDWTGTRSDPDAGLGDRSQAANWNQDWPRLGPLDVSTLLGWSDERFEDRRVKRKNASLGLRGTVVGNLRWDSSFTFVDVDDDLGGERNYNASIGLDWNPSPPWTFALSWYRNRVQPGPTNSLAPFTRDNSVLLTARYEGSAGSPYLKGQEGGPSRSGTGGISGSVFFDENGDGARQPNERGAPGVTVVLDDRRSATTDPDGRYVFPLVAVGRHRIRLIVERVPLPWGLEDDLPREVTVDMRSDARLDIGLQRVSP